MTTPQQLCTFYLDDQLFGVDVQSVQEVIRYQEMTRVPLAASAVSGLINLRGQIVTAVDLRRKLGLSDRPKDRLPMNVVVRDDEGAVSLLVDQIGDVIDVEPERIDSPPDTLSGPARELIRRAYKLDHQLLLMLDAKEAIEIPA